MITQLQLYNFNPRPLAGATSGAKKSLDGFTFQSTPPCGGDCLTKKLHHLRRHFNPRPLAGATFNIRMVRDHRKDFNPRPLAGATIEVKVKPNKPTISIHAPLRGRPTRRRSGCRMILFQSTPPCGGDKMIGVAASVYRDFNPRPLAGATIIVTVEDELKLFQSTPPCGGDCEMKNIADKIIISIHAPLRGRLIRHLKHAT